MSVRAVLFDLDMTLLDTSALEKERAAGNWALVHSNLNMVKPFSPNGVDSHELPAMLNDKGILVGVVTSSPRPYAKALLSRFKIPFDTLITGSDGLPKKPSPETITYALTKLGVAATEAVYVGDSRIDFEASARAGVFSIGAKWGMSEPPYSRMAPDFIVRSPKFVLNIDQYHRYRYSAEAYLAGQIPLSAGGLFLPVNQKEKIFALGRYFPTKDPRHATSLLSNALLDLKDNDAHAKMLGLSLGTFMQIVKPELDWLVPVPAKPGDHRSRFKLVVHEALAEAGLKTKLKEDALIATKKIQGYKEMNHQQRHAALQGVYKATGNPKGKHVLLLDDVYTSGSTVSYCRQELLNAGASQVTTVCFGADQDSVFEVQECPACGRPMRVRTNSMNKSKFWGCTGFSQGHCNKTISIN